MDEPTKELFTSLVRNSLYALCKNRNLLNNACKLDALVGVTLGNNEVVLININESLDDKKPTGVPSIKQPLEVRQLNVPIINNTGEQYETAARATKQRPPDPGQGPDNMELFCCAPASDGEDWMCLKEEPGEETSKKKKRRKMVVLGSAFGTDNNDAEPCCKCHPRSSGSCVRCHPNGGQCNSLCRNKNCRWRPDPQDLPSATITGARPPNVPATSHDGSPVPGSSICGDDKSKATSSPNDTPATSGWAADYYQEMEETRAPYIDLPTPEPLEIPNVSREEIMSFYGQNLGNFELFSVRIMESVFTVTERLKKCNVQGKFGRSKLEDTDERINQIYELVYHMYRISEDEREDVKRRIIRVIDSRNRHLRRRSIYQNQPKPPSENSDSPS